jgi:hypothetical protein
MNIFYLHKSPVVSAQAQTDKHVVKMILETAQLLSTAHRVLDGEHYIDASSGRKLQRWKHSDSLYEKLLYKATHFNHPCALWVRESVANYIWTYEHFVALSDEYTKRYSKIHKSYRELADILSIPPVNIPNIPMTEFKLAIANKTYIVEGKAISSYRRYYEAEKLILPNDIERYYKILDLERKLG